MAGNSRPFRPTLVHARRRCLVPAAGLAALRGGAPLIATAPLGISRGAVPMDRALDMAVKDAHDPDDFRRVPVRIRQLVRDAAGELEAVALVEIEDLGSDGEPDPPLRHEAALFSFPDNHVLALSPRRQRDDHEPQIAVVPRRWQLFDEAGHADDDLGAIGFATHELRRVLRSSIAGGCRGMRVEELPEIDAQGGAKPLQGLDRGIRIAALDLADQPRRYACPLGELRDGERAGRPQVTKLGAKGFRIAISAYRRDER